MVPGMPVAPVREEPVDHLTQGKELGGPGGAGVDQHRALVAAQQEQERRLVMDRHVLPQDERVVVVGVDLDVRVRVVLGRR